MPLIPALSWLTALIPTLGELETENDKVGCRKDRNIFRCRKETLDVGRKQLDI